MIDIVDHSPPRWPRKFLRWYCNPDMVEDIEGDIHEDFNRRYQRYGAFRARLLYTLDVIRFFRPFAIRKFPKTQIFNSMFKINTRIAFRNLAKNKLYSFINISGLAIGIAACIIIAHYVSFQMSFDNYHENGDRVFRLNLTTYQKGEYTGTGIYCGYALGPALERDIPEMERFARVHPEYGGAIMNRVVDSLDRQSYREEDILYVDPDFLQMFTLEFLQGNQNSLDDPNSIIMSESMAKKYFGDNIDQALGSTIRATGGWGDGLIQVTGVFKDVPANSHLKFDFLKPIDLLLSQGQYQREGADWGWTNFFMYAQLIEQTTEIAVEAKIADLMHQYTPEDLEAASMKQTLSLQAIRDIHLKSTTDDGDGEFADSKNINSVYFMILIATFILIIAWINFINLSTAKASERGMEVGVKKAMGALRPQLVFQFLTESFWINVLAIALALGLSYFLLPIFGNLIDVPMALDLTHPAILIGIVVLILAGPFLAGIYPAFVLSSFKTVSALKGVDSIKMKHQFSLRRVLVIFQFVISTLLIAGTFVVSRQLDFMRNRDTGLNMSEVLVIKGPEVGINRATFESFKNAMTSFSKVESFATSRSIPGAGYNFGTFARNINADQSADKRIDITWIDRGFMDTYELELVAGRDFSDAINGSDNGALISETAVRAYNYASNEEAVGDKMIVSGDTVTIRGVVKDHNWQSLHSAYAPSAFYYVPATATYFSLRVSSENRQDVIREAEEQYLSTFPGNPLEYFFLNDFFNRQYQEDQTFGKIFNAFAIFAIIAACMGLFGLASYSVVQKAKEIGIRKVLGASSLHITMLFSRRYMLLILIANVVAVPLTYFAIKEWLQDFAFSISITPDLFVLPIALLAVIATITISAQTVRAALDNPVKNLRSE